MPISEPSVTLSFANNFWGKDDAGVGPLLQRMHDAKTTCDELKNFYMTRHQIEDEYSRRMIALSRKPFGSCESGSLKASMDVLRHEVEQMGKAHQNIASQMKTELEEPLGAFAGAMRERRKIVQNGVEKLMKLKIQQTQQTRDRYEQDCLRIKGYLAQGHMVMGQEERKNKAKLEKAQIQLASSNAEYQAAIKALEETTQRWNRDWKAACDKFQDLEEERIDFIKSSLWTFANVASTVCVSDDASCEKVRLSLENCEVEKDITSFIRDKGTGQEIPDPPKYINFCRGDLDDDGVSEAGESSYSVAQFSRQGNPAYRSSSPNPSNPSTYSTDSHDDPPTPTQSSSKAIAKRRSMGVEPRSATKDRTPNRSSKHQQIANTAHNDYPLDGMTMYCRATPSDRSSASSPARPPSSHASSDYSSATSVSSGSDTIPTPSERQERALQQKEQQLREQHQLLQQREQQQQLLQQREQQQQLEQQERDDTPTVRSRGTWSASSAPPRALTTPNLGGSTSSRHTPALTFGNEHVDNSEPIDPRASLALNIGGNVFDIATPALDRNTPSKKEEKPPAEEAEPLDPIAQALAELKGATKGTPAPREPPQQPQSPLDFRKSADRYYGLQTPAPGTPVPQPSTPAPLRKNTEPAAAAQRGTPPPSYHSPVKRSTLGTPAPAFTAAEMKERTREYQEKSQFMLEGPPIMPAAQAEMRPGTRGSDRTRTASRQSGRGSVGGRDSVIGFSGPEPAHTPSPAPTRSISPRPQSYSEQQQQQHTATPQPQPTNYNRSRSPAPYAVSRPPTQTSMRPGTQASNRPGTAAPGQYQAYSRAASPNPMTGGELVMANARGNSPAPPTVRGHSPVPPLNRSHSPAPSVASYGRRTHRSNTAGPGSVYGNEHARHSFYDDTRSMGGRDTRNEQRPRSKSVVHMGAEVTRDGLPILKYARALYSYTPVINEELGFQKGDVLAILRLQDDGWWEGEVVGNEGIRGLVPSNYLQNV
ncbi:hypothetical protein BJ508DRAFT_207045 [Ascobolus immersus RN42]|uniref:SH3 domain-containing protein n=1 Tax=Ascobolus immersus RN42 TaxID=1160509 RepID=A0A3N4IG71_ASCIM|nr:hypothetical protein BJ508DRAFT_207045 [Ascobolus immersus RN42]